jgi:hypothetical protein
LLVSAFGGVEYLYVYDLTDMNEDEHGKSTLMLRCLERNPSWRPIH